MTDFVTVNPRRCPVDASAKYDPWPRLIAAHELAARYPRCRVRLQADGSTAEAAGRIVARTVEARPRYDVRLDAGGLLANVEGARVTVLAPGEG